MRILGVLVGVDVQLDEGIEQLPFAGADPEWLHALLAGLNQRDPHGCDGDIVLLRGTDATRVSVTAALKSLADRSGETDADLVVVHFSCHGTPQGHLLLADAGAGEESTTGLPFEEVARALEAVSAVHVVASFDTCFSGRAVGIEPSTRAEAVEARMDRLATENRCVEHIRYASRLGRRASAASAAVRRGLEYAKGFAARKRILTLSVMGTETGRNVPNEGSSARWRFGACRRQLGRPRRGRRRRMRAEHSRVPQQLSDSGAEFPLPREGGGGSTRLSEVAAIRGRIRQMTCLTQSRELGTQRPDDQDQQAGKLLDEQ